MSKIPNASQYEGHTPIYGISYLINTFRQPVHPEEVLWQMLESTNAHSRERAFAVIMVRIYNNVEFKEPQPFQRAYDVLQGLGDWAGLFMLRHFVATAEATIPKRCYESLLCELFNPCSMLQIEVPAKPTAVELTAVPDDQPQTAIEAEAPPAAEVVDSTAKPKAKRVGGKKDRKALGVTATTEEPPPLEEVFEGAAPAFMGPRQVIDTTPAEKPKSKRVSKTKELQAA